jgi:hypothetical protein
MTQALRLGATLGAKLPLYSQNHSFSIYHHLGIAESFHLLGLGLTEPTFVSSCSPMCKHEATQRGFREEAGTQEEPRGMPNLQEEKSEGHFSPKSKGQYSSTNTPVSVMRVRQPALIAPHAG